MNLRSTHSFNSSEPPFIFLLFNGTNSSQMVLIGLARAKENVVVFLQEGSS